MNDTKKAYVAAVMQTCIIGFSFMFVKIGLRSAHPLDVLAYRFFFAFLASTSLIFTRKVSLQFKIEDFKNIAPLALFYPILFFSLQAFGLLFITSTEAGIIQALVPVLTVTLASFILKERTNAPQKFFILLSVGGIIYVSAMNGKSSVDFNIMGTVLIFLSVLSTSLYNVFARKLTQKYHFYTLTFFMNSLGFVVFTLLSLGMHAVYGTGIDYLTPFTDIQFVVAVLYLGVLSSFGTSFLSNYALSKIEASKMSVFANLTPVITILSGVFLLNESLKLYQIIGIAVTLLGVFGTNIFKNKK